MAGEIIGKVSEASVALALEYAGYNSLNLHWGVKPKGMSIQTDFLIGRNPDIPDVVMLVTHSISSMQSHKKFWRNIGELVELQTFLQNIPLTVNIVFGDARMEKLSTILAECFDLTVSMTTLKNSDLLMEELRNACITCRSKTKFDTKSWLANNLSPASKSFLQELGYSILAAIENEKSSKTKLWQLIRDNQKKQDRNVKKTTLKRGTAKLLVYSKEERAAIYTAAKRRVGLKMPTPYLATNLQIMGGLGNLFVVDDDIQHLCRSWELDEIEYIISCAPLESVKKIAIEPLMAMKNLEEYSSYVINNYENLTQKEGMKTALRQCHINPQSLCSLSSPISNVWLADFLMTLIKAHLGGHNDYGQSQLALDAGVNEGISGSGYRFFADWLNRKEKGKLSDETLDAISSALTIRLREISPKRILELLADIKQKYIRLYYEIKLLTYEKFDPLLYVIEKALRDFNISYQEISRFPSAFGEYANVRAASSSLVKSKNTLIYWQSSHGSHTNDKKKELCGRVAGLKYSWDEGSNQFVPRTGVKKTILVIDGDWQASDVETLYSAGWDTILYPDEVSRLIHEII